MILTPHLLPQTLNCHLHPPVCFWSKHFPSSQQSLDSAIAICGRANANREEQEGI